MSKRQASTQVQTQQPKKINLTEDRVWEILKNAVNDSGKQKGKPYSENSNKSRKREVMKIVDAGLFGSVETLSNVEALKKAFGGLNDNSMAGSFGHLSTFFKNSPPEELGLTLQQKEHLTKAYSDVGKALKKPYEDMRAKGEKSAKEEALWIPDWIAHKDKSWEEFQLMKKSIDMNLSPSSKMIYDYSMAILYILQTHFFNIRGLWRTVKLCTYPGADITQDSILCFDDFGDMFVRFVHRKNDREGHRPIHQKIPREIASILSSYILKFRVKSQWLFTAVDGVSVMKPSSFCENIQRLSQQYYGKPYGIQILRKVQITYDFSKHTDTSMEGLDALSRQYHHSILEHLLYVKKQTEYAGRVDLEETIEDRDVEEIE